MVQFYLPGTFSIKLPLAPRPSVPGFPASVSGIPAKGQE